MLKIMSLNCNYLSNQHGIWLKRKKVIQELIAEADPDIIALQAVYQNPKGKDQARQIAEANGYGYYFFVAASENEDGSREGQAMITKYPFGASYSTELTLRPGLDDTSHRLILVAEIETVQGLVRIFNTHFSWQKEQAKENARETLSFLEDFPGMGILIGDLHADNGSRVLDPLKKAGWKDAWQLLDKNGSGYPLDTSLPRARIDYVFVNSEMNPLVRDIKVLSKESEHHQMRISDHGAILVELDVVVAPQHVREHRLAASRG